MKVTIKRKLKEQAVKEGSTMGQFHPDAMDDETKTSGVGGPVDVKREQFYEKFRDLVEDATAEMYDKTTPEQMIAVLGQDDGAAARVQAAVNIQQADKQMLMQMIAQAQSGGEGLSEEQRQMFFEFLVATAIEFGLHGANTASEYSHQGHSGRVVGRKRRMQFALKDMIYAHLYKYLRDPSGASPSALSARWSKQAMNYGEEGDLPDVVYNLRENWKRFL